MKRKMIILLCLALSLFALFGCAKETEESIPEGWIEYDLPDIGIKIALPPHYVAAAEGLTPTDADYERAGAIEEEVRKPLENMVTDNVKLPNVRLYIVSSQTFASGIIGIFDASIDAGLLGADTTNALNIERYSELVFDVYKSKKYSMDCYGADGSIAGRQLCYAIFEMEYTDDEEDAYYIRKYAALFEGEKVELQFIIEKEQAESNQIIEFDEIAKMLEID